MTYPTNNKECSVTSLDTQWHQLQRCTQISSRPPRLGSAMLRAPAAPCAPPRGSSSKASMAFHWWSLRDRREASHQTRSCKVARAAYQKKQLRTPSKVAANALAESPKVRAKSEKLRLRWLQADSTFIGPSINWLAESAGSCRQTVSQAHVGSPQPKGGASVFLLFFPTPKRLQKCKAFSNFALALGPSPSSKRSKGSFKMFAGDSILAMHHEAILHCQVQAILLQEESLRKGK